MLPVTDAYYKSSFVHIFIFSLMIVVQNVVSGSLSYSVVIDIALQIGVMVKTVKFFTPTPYEIDDQDSTAVVCHEDSDPLHKTELVVLRHKLGIRSPFRPNPKTNFPSPPNIPAAPNPRYESYYGAQDPSTVVLCENNSDLLNRDELVVPHNELETLFERSPLGPNTETNDPFMSVSDQGYDTSYNQAAIMTYYWCNKTYCMQIRETGVAESEFETDDLCTNDDTFGCKSVEESALGQQRANRQRLVSGIG